MKEFSRSRETQKSFREHAKLFWGAVIKKTWGAGSRGLNFEGSGVHIGLVFLTQQGEIHVL